MADSSRGPGLYRRWVKRPLVRVLLIGASERPLRIPGLERMRWSEASETAILSEIDVGIMPLADTPFARGKCAFKLIQYMASWKPVVASPVGENNAVVKHGVNGFLANDANDWVESLDRLARDPDLRRVMGETGRRAVEQRYSLTSATPALAAILREAAVSASAERA